VVENTERCIDEGDEPRAAAHRSMSEVSRALIATSLVLVAVFVPTAFVPGISGQFYTQFALTIATATLVSTLNSLTLSPALAAILLKPRNVKPSTFPLARLGNALATRFNQAFDKLANAYARIVRLLVGSTVSLLSVIAVFGALLAATAWLADRVPQGFIPVMDQGYAIVVVKLPDGASLERTDAVIQRASDIARETPGITNAVGFAGLDGATFTLATNAGVIFTTFDSYENRLASGQTANAIIGNLFGRMQAVQEAFIIAIPPPPIRGIGTGGGFKLQLQDRDSAEVNRVLASAFQLMGAAQQNESVAGVFTTFSASSPQLFLDIERDKARMLNVPIPAIFETLAINLGTSYVNDFNAFGRVNQVRAQADEEFRLDIEDIERLKVRSATGALVPLGTLVDIRTVAGPNLVQRYNMYVSVPVQGNTPPGVSTGQSLDAMEAMAEQIVPPGVSYEWTELAFQQRQAANTIVFIFGLSVLFAFLVLAAQYESWVLPIAIILIVPMGVFSALVGVMLRGMDNNILTQIGLIVLVGLAAKNAILIVEFARQGEDRGKALVEATVEACRLRLRPILMTAFAFILGVVPLMIATGPGAEMRQSLGTAVFSGMLGVTLFGLFLTPVFYVALRRLTGMGPCAIKTRKRA
jgi:HAE1 family hydrophobic/amphiphilic exporter-1